MHRPTFTILDLVRIATALLLYRTANRMALLAASVIPPTHPAAPMLEWRGEVADVLIESMKAPLATQNDGGGGTPAPYHRQTPVTRAA